MPQSTQPPRAPKNQEYGQAGAQLISQRQIPLSKKQVGSPTGTTGRPRSTRGQIPFSDSGTMPGSIPSLSDPTSNPNEPVTAGLPIGAGPGPEALSTASFGPEELSVLRGVLLRYPNNDIRRLIEWSESTLA